MNQEFKAKGRGNDPILAQEIYKAWEDKKKRAVEGLETAVNLLPLQAQQNVEAVRTVSQNFGNTCFLVDVLACSDIPQTQFSQQEMRLRELLAQKSLIDGAGVLTAGNIVALNEFFSSEVGVSLKAFPDEQLSEFELGRMIVSLIQENKPLMINFELAERTQAGHWVVLIGVMRDDAMTTKWIVMDPAHRPGNKREITSEELARYIVGNAGFVPQMMVAERKHQTHFVPKNKPSLEVGSVFRPKNTNSS